MPRTGAVAIVLAAVALSSCGDGARQGAYSVRDSSGVEIVSNPAAVPGDSLCPSVDSVPLLTIGGPDAEGPYDVQRVGGALRVENGGVVVLDGATSELRFFDSAGRYARSVGRAGSGPGEFQRPAGLSWYASDTLAVGDYATARLSLLDARGRFLAAIPLQALRGAEYLGRLGDGSLVLAAYHGYVAGSEASGRRRDPMHVVSLTPTGVVRDTIGEFPGFELVVVADEQRMSVALAPFGRGTFVAMHDGRLHVADNAEYRVRVYQEGRRLELIVQREHAAVPISEADIRREMARRAPSTPSRPQLEAVEQMLRRDQLPRSLPAHGPIFVDAEGWLWVRAYSDASEGDVSWDVFDASGRLRCAVSLPAALYPREIGRDFLLGVSTDADGVEQVQLYRLRRGVRGTS